MASYYAEQFAGDNYFGQSGTNIPSFGIQGGYAGGSSTDVPPYFGGYVSNAPAPATNFLNNFIAQEPSFDLSPHIDSPAVDRIIENYKANPAAIIHPRYQPGELEQKIRQLRNSLLPPA
jgi:hypothetical protein